jgi:hypothetical protein
MRAAALEAALRMGSPTEEDDEATLGRLDLNESSGGVTTSVGSMRYLSPTEDKNGVTLETPKKSWLTHTA